MEHGGLRMTVPARTTVDGLRRLRRPFALSAADAMARAGWVVRAELDERIDRLRGFPGVVQARSLVRLVDPETAWPGESWTKLRLVDAGCPIPRSQLWIVDVKGRRAALDLGYEHAKVGCEYDGREVHTLDEDTAPGRRAAPLAARSARLADRRGAQGDGLHPRALVRARSGGVAGRDRLACHDCGEPQPSDRATTTLGSRNHNPRIAQPEASDRGLLGDAVDVEHAGDGADGGEHVAEVGGVAHLEGEAALGDPVAARSAGWRTGC